MKKLVVREVAGGKGVYAEEPIRAGDAILPFTGPFLHYKDTSPTTYALQIGPDLYIGASGSFDDYINHSCEPNSGMRIRGTTAVLHAVRDIPAGEQIVFDYSTIMAEDDFEMDCWCGTPSCRKRIRDGKHLPDELWERYVALGIIPDHVLQARLRMRGG